MNRTETPHNLNSISLDGLRTAALNRDLLPRQKGTYVLWIHLYRARHLVIGRLGQYHFNEGWYAYAGSAFGPGGLRARILHHIRGTRNPRWHIDYLTRIAPPHEVWTTMDPERWEHPLAQWIESMDGSSIPAPGFGCSDCRCRSHLFEFEFKPRLSSLMRMRTGI